MSGFHTPWRRMTQARRILHPALSGGARSPWRAAALAAAIWLLVAFALAIVILLIVAVQAPEALDSAPPWIRDSVDADAWWTVLALAFATCGAAMLYRASRRRKETSLAYIVGVSLTLTTFLLAIPTYTTCTGPQAPFWAPLTWTLSLFLGAVNNPFGSTCPGPMPLALQVASLSAILTTFLSLLAVALAALSSQRDRIRVRLFARSTVLIFGLDAFTLPFIEALVEQDGRGSTVIVSEPDRTNPLVPEVRRLGVRVLFGDPLDATHIERLAVRKGILGRRSILRAAYVLTPQGSEAITIAGNVLEAAEAPRADESYPRLVARIDDPRQAEAWRRAQVANELRVLTDTVGLYRVTAQVVVDRALAGQAERLVLLGSSPITLAILEELAQQRREASVAGTALPPIETIVVCEDAREIVDDHVRSQSWFFDGLNEQDVPRAGERQPTVSSVEEAAEPFGRGTYVVVAIPPSAEQEQLTSRLALRHPLATFLLRREDTQGLVPGRVLPNVAAFGLTLVATRTRARRRNTVLPEDGWQRIARRLHERYIEHRVDDARRSSERDWDHLPPFYRESNLRRVAVALQLVTQAGRTWTLQPGQARVPLRLERSEVEALAYLEHDSWCRYYRAHGWRRGSRRESVVRGLRHPALVPWADLPERDCEYTVASLIECLEYLEAMGYVPFDGRAHSAGRRFLRRGSVTARRREKAWTWTTDSGAVMSARPGDWEVSDDAGACWSITDVDFHSTYEHVDGDTYRRTGSVLARPSLEGEQVASSEGIETARAGDWIVQDPAGNRWIVPVDRFVAAYVESEPAPAPPAGG